MSIATYKTAIKTWVEAQSGLTAQWAGEAGGWQPKTRIRLHLFSIAPRGVDIIQYKQDTGLDAGEDFVPTFSGLRELVLSIDVTSRDQSGSNVAHTYLDKLRTSLRKPAVRSALRTAGLAHSVTETVVDLSSSQAALRGERAHWVDDRHESRAVMDVRFNAVVNEEDEAAAESFVQTYKITSDLTDVDAGAHHDDGEETYP